MLLQAERHQSVSLNLRDNMATVLTKPSVLLRALLYISAGQLITKGSDS